MSAVKSGGLNCRKEFVDVPDQNMEDQNRLVFHTGEDRVSFFFWQGTMANTQKDSQMIPDGINILESHNLREPNTHEISGFIPQEKGVKALSQPLCKGGGLVPKNWRQEN